MLHVTCHTSHVTRHTSHVTRHTSHVTRHLLPLHVPLHCLFKFSLRHTQGITRAYVADEKSHVTTSIALRLVEASHVIREEAIAAGGLGGIQADFVEGEALVVARGDVEMCGVEERKLQIAGFVVE